MSFTLEFSLEFGDKVFEVEVKRGGGRSFMTKEGCAVGVRGDEVNPFRTAGETAWEDINGDDGIELKLC